MERARPRCSRPTPSPEPAPRTPQIAQAVTHRPRPAVAVRPSSCVSGGAGHGMRPTAYASCGGCTISTWCPPPTRQPLDQFPLPGRPLCRAGSALPRTWRSFAAWVAPCRVGGGPLPRGSRFAAQVAPKGPKLGPATTIRAAKLHPRGKARPPDLQSTTTHAARRDPRGKGPPGPQPARQRSGGASGLDLSGAPAIVHRRLINEWVDQPRR
jgi:hypothetical protein